ncbi:MAG: aryl-sulfate sulfotransferase [Anaerolineales bacterium]|nr:aryl-sulfate sulfotransferase [Anaerolineales bacterium]
MRPLRRALLLLVVMLATTRITALADEPSLLELIPSLPSGQPIGTVIDWQISSTAEDVLNQVSVSRNGEPYRVFRGYSAEEDFTWASLQEGDYLLQVEQLDRASGQITTTTASFTLTPRIDSEAAVFASDHPLVALYSMPACPPDATKVVVAYRRSDSQRIFSTHQQPCDGPFTNNLYIGGLRGDSSYLMRHAYLDSAGNAISWSEVLSFQSGSVTLDWGSVTVQPIRPAEVSADEPLLVQSILGRADGPHYTVTTDFDGALVWYYDPGIVLQSYTYLTRMLSEGRALFVMPDENTYAQVVREVDLAGNVVGQTTVDGINVQLAAMGKPLIGGIHHEAMRLENGHTLVLTAYERFIEDLQGPGLVNVMGDMVIDLDENWQVVWAWDSFEHLDVSRMATLRERCWTTCDAPLQNGRVANDWTHSNTIDYSPSDGNIIVSIRNQDWIIKLDYQDGNGNGDILWKLGLQGDFAIDPPTPKAWFTHQHDTRYLSDNRIMVYDNGTLRCELTDQCESRGQVYEIDEATMSARLIVNTNLGKYAAALGATQRLSNGNFHFSSGGLQDAQGNYFSDSDEVTPRGLPVFRTAVTGAMYRSYRLSDMYSAPDP